MSDLTDAADFYALTSDTISRFFTFNWILSSMGIQRRSRSTLFVIFCCSLGHLILTDLLPVQLVLLNGGSLIGRLSTGFIAPYVGVPRLIVISTAACGILILGMIGLDRIPTVVVLGTIYGYFSGVCQSLSFPNS